jgi:vitamin B12 transport system substrate-binding protein
VAKSLNAALAVLMLLAPAWLFAAPRVITLSPANTELAFAAGITPVGVSSYSDYPPEAAKIEQVSSWQGMNLERIVALKPDLVLAWRGGNAERQVNQLSSLGIKSSGSKHRPSKRLSQRFASWRSGARSRKRRGRRRRKCRTRTRP